MLTDFLTSRFYITLNHNSFYQRFDGRIHISAVKYIHNDADLLHILLVGVGVIRVHNNRTAKMLMLVIQLIKQKQIFVVIVGHALALLVDISA